jgi:hypothetical protein
MRALGGNAKVAGGLKLAAEGVKRIRPMKKGHELMPGWYKRKFRKLEMGCWHQATGARGRTDHRSWRRQMDDMNAVFLYT